MNRVPRLVASVALTALFAAMPVFDLAQSQSDRTIDQYKCRDVMRDPGPSRDAAVAFLHGYLLGRSGGQSFNVETLHKQTEAFIEHCLSNPDSKAVDSMTAAKK